MQNSVRNWDSVGLGIIAFSTTLAVATAAGVLAVREFDDGLPRITTVLATVMATISLVAYLFVVPLGLATIVRELQAEQKGLLVKAAFSVLAQSYAAVLAAGIVIYFPLLERIPG